MKTRFYAWTDRSGKVLAYYRTVPPGNDQIWNGTDWVACPTDAFARRLMSGDPFIDELPGDPTK